MAAIVSGVERPLLTVTVAGPAGVSIGTCALISVALAYSSGAVNPSMVTDAPPSVAGSGNVVANAVELASADPAIEISDPGATGPVAKLAELAIASGGAFNPKAYSAVFVAT